MPAPGDSNAFYNIQNIAVSCSGAGKGTITLSGVSTGETTSLTVLIYQFSAEVIAEYEYGPNTVNGSNQFTNLANGKHTIEVYPSDSSVKSYERTVNCGEPPPPVDDITLTLSHVTPPSDNLATDGQIFTFMSGSNLPLRARINNGELIQDKTHFTGIGVGKHIIYVQDAAGFFRTLEVTVGQPIPDIIRGCMDPNATNYNPDAEEDDGSCIFPLPPSPVFFIPLVNSLRFVVPANFDNRYIFPNFDNTLFCQEVMPGAYKPWYFQKVARDDIFKIQFYSNFGNHTITLHQHTGNAEIKTFTYETVEPGLVEALISLQDVSDGRYYVQILAEDEDFAPVTAISEPFSLKEVHPNTSLIAYRHSKNKFDVVYSTNIEHLVRIESKFYKRQPESTRSVYRNCNGALIKLGSSHYRKFLFETYRLPPWLHEKLVLILDHDQLLINGMPYQTENDYEISEPEGHALSNGKVLVEQVGWFGLHTSVVISEPPVIDDDRLEFNGKEFN